MNKVPTYLFVICREPLTTIIFTAGGEQTLQRRDCFLLSAKPYTDSSGPYSYTAHFTSSTIGSNPQTNQNAPSPQRETWKIQIDDQSHQTLSLAPKCPAPSRPNPPGTQAKDNAGKPESATRA